MASRLFKRPWARSNDGGEAVVTSRPETPEDDDFHDAEEVRRIFHSNTLLHNVFCLEAHSGSFSIHLKQGMGICQA